MSTFWRISFVLLPGKRAIAIHNLSTGLGAVANSQAQADGNAISLEAESCLKVRFRVWYEFFPLHLPGSLRRALVFQKLLPQPE